MVSCDKVHYRASRVLCFIPETVRSLFVPPQTDDLQSRGDLVYEWGQAVLHMPQLLRRLAFKTRTAEEELQEAMLRGNLRKTFTKFDLLMLGLGIVIGSGVFSLTGKAAALTAGSAVVVSYIIMGIACMCAAACYAELAVEYPVAGSAFTYTLVTFGEFPAYITMGMLLLQYVVAMAAVGQGFSQYLALLCNQSATLFVIETGVGVDIDIMAFGVILVLSLALTFGVRESATFINIVTVAKLVLIVFICIMGYVYSQPGTFSSQFTLHQKGTDGIFQGAAIIMFAYVAFDAVCNAVEETQRVEYIPPAILGTVGISGTLYIMLAVALCVMVTPTQLNECADDRGDPDPLYHAPLTAADSLVCASDYSNKCAYIADKTQSPYSVMAWSLGYVFAFNEQGAPYMQYFVATTALFGITTCLLVGLFSVSRLVMVAAREWLLPPFLAQISPRTQTPKVAQLAAGVVIALLALLAPYNSLSQIVNFGALFAMWAVCNTVLYRRYYPGVKVRFTEFGTVEAAKGKKVFKVPGSKLPLKWRKILAGFHLLAINALSIAYSIYYRITVKTMFDQCPDEVDADTLPPENQHHSYPVMISFAGVWFAGTLSMLLLCPMDYEPSTWSINRWLLPWFPSLAILLIVFSAASLEVVAFKAMGYFTIALVLVYLFFSMPLSYIRHYKLGQDAEDDTMVVELVYAEGKWTPADAVSTRPTAPALMSMDYSTAGYKLNGNSSRTFWNSSRVLSPLSSTMVSTEPGSSGSAHSGAVGAVGAPANGMGDSVLSTSGGVGRHWHWRRLSALTEEVNEKE